MKEMRRKDKATLGFRMGSLVVKISTLPIIESSIYAQFCSTFDFLKIFSNLLNVENLKET